ncbi:hypoxanthine phosphoribosyltransferase [Catalinimonas alkaloidigena]|uniref:hypoxanthine phosphoribosyltransferase n=1 Tax=Catalinimonas alkaloidigena TaxID=1075417 RepID=UPI000B7E6FCB|nr:hypoxanthine phosphoribosyltransferase [Catalinimonas alkaloidigena]
MESSVTIHDKSFRLFLSEDELQQSIARLGQQLTDDYRDRNPIFVVVLNGAFIFAADLLKCVETPCEVTFVKVASYQATQSTGEVEEILGLEEDLHNRHVVIVEDIVDTGLTMSALLDSVREMRPASVEVATLLLKPKALKRPLSIRYVGNEIENRFVVGFGLDYDGLGRNLRHLYQLSTQ